MPNDTTPEAPEHHEGSLLLSGAGNNPEQEN